MRLSLCMIVKNEEKNLARCLESVKGKVDEMIVVDTGSTDRTREIASECGAVVYSHLWKGDFAEARNKSVSLAVGDFILTLDGDEEFIGERQDLIDLASVPIDRLICYSVRIENVTEGGMVDHYMSRYFPKNDKIRWEGSIHERVEAQGVTMIHVPTDKIKIRHHGYKNKQMSEDKNRVERNETALLAELKKNKNNTSYLYHLAIEYCTSNQGKKAIGIFEKWDRLVSQKNDMDVSSGYSAYIGQLAVFKEWKRAKQIGDRVVFKCAHDPGFCLNYGLVLGQFTENYDLAIKYFYRAIEAGNGKSPTLLYDREASGWKAYLSIGTIQMKKNEVGLAIEAWRKGLEFSPKNRLLMKHLISILMQVGGWLEAEEYLIDLMNEYEEERTDTNKLFIANVYYNTDREIQGLEMCWSLPGRKEYLDQLLSQLIADQKYDKVKQVDEFIKSKMELAEAI